VLGVGDGVADDVLEEDLEHAAGLLVDEAGDTLDATPPGEPPDRRLGDALDVVAEHLAVALGAALAQPLAALAAPRHRRNLQALGEPGGILGEGEEGSVEDDLDLSVGLEEYLWSAFGVGWEREI
jgi:hypothetical protein